MIVIQLVGGLLIAICLGFVISAVLREVRNFYRKPWEPWER